MMKKAQEKPERTSPNSGAVCTFNYLKHSDVNKSYLMGLVNR
jgi:hypothetical protein